MPHARRDRQYLIIILYITDHGLRNFGKGRYVPRSPLANRQIPAEPRFGSDLRPALKKPATTSKKGFQKKFPSIGDSGAEKVLLFTRSYPVMALDSNGLRVLCRVGFADEQKNYSATYRLVQDAIRSQLPRDYDSLIGAHRLLRQHGQELCKRSKPRCAECPVSRTTGMPH